MGRGEALCVAVRSKCEGQCTCYGRFHLAIRLSMVFVDLLGPLCPLAPQVQFWTPPQKNIPPLHSRRPGSRLRSRSSTNIGAEHRCRTRCICRIGDPHNVLYFVVGSPQPTRGHVLLRRPKGTGRRECPWRGHSVNQNQPRSSPSTPQRAQVSAGVGKPSMDSECASGCTWSTARATARL